MENNAMITFKDEGIKYTGVLIKKDENFCYGFTYLKEERCFATFAIKNLKYSICNCHINKDHLDIYNALYDFFTKKENADFFDKIFYVLPNCDFSSMNIAIIFDLEDPGIDDIDLNKSLELLKFLKNSCKNPKKAFKLMGLNLEQTKYILYEGKLFKPC